MSNHTDSDARVARCLHVPGSWVRMIERGAMEAPRREPLSIDLTRQGTLAWVPRRPLGSSLQPPLRQPLSLVLLLQTSLCLTVMWR
jgi:hypothetical protein